MDALKRIRTMTKWTYMIIECIRTINRVIVAGGYNVDLSWIKSRFPKARLDNRWAGDGYFHAAIDPKGSVELSLLADAVLQYLGSQGWEAYAASGGAQDFQIHLKRPTDGQ
jgi:hypothetical protein